MKTKFSTSWKASKQPRKQRKYRNNAPLHIKRKLIGTHLSKQLRDKYGKRAVEPKKGDSVKILRGQYKGKTGKIERTNVKQGLVYITGIDITKKDGTKSLRPLQPSNMIITELSIDDKKRQNILSRGAK
jgi:large subunit ribosomal protein L24